MRTIRVMADYGCYPLWEVSSDGLSNINPEELPISSTLKARLNLWSQKYEQTFDEEYPPDSGFSSLEEEEYFKTEGLLILNDLKLELASQFEIIYSVP